MSEQRGKILVVSTQNGAHSPAIDSLRQFYEVVEASAIDGVIAALRSDHFVAVFADSSDFLPVERALASQQASLILNTIGEGVCIVDGEGRCNWMNKRMQDWPPRVRESVRRACREAFEFFSRQITPQAPLPESSRSKRYPLALDEQFLELVASPVLNARGQLVQVAAVIWDATPNLRLQQKIRAIDRAGGELVRLEADAMSRLSVAERLKLLEDKIISYSRELMHFDHFAIRLLDRKTNKLEVVMSQGLPQEALNVELYARSEGNGISGWVAANDKSYMCSDVEADPRYLPGLDKARSSLTVPLRLHDKVIGVFNIESGQRAAFTEDDRQFAEIFGRYVAIALNILDLMVVERAGTAHKVADNVSTEMAGPLNDISLDASSLMEEFIGHDELRHKLQAILDNVGLIRKALRTATEGPSTVLGAAEVQEAADPVLAGARVLVADDDPNIRNTITDVLRKHHADVTSASNGGEAIGLVESRPFDLVISDIRMPDKSGYDVFAAARKHSQTLPVILMTGFGYDPNHCIVRASQEGLQAVLFKPFKVQQFLAEVRKALQSRVGR